MANPAVRCWQFLETAATPVRPLPPSFLRRHSPIGDVGSITWSDYIGDASGKSVTFSENIYNTIKSSYPAPHLVLNHGTVETTSGQVLPYAIPLLEDVGYTLVTVDHCLGDSSPYQSIGRPQVRDSTWHC